jgi:hypothetical protein
MLTAAHADKATAAAYISFAPLVVITTKPIAKAASL